MKLVSATTEIHKKSPRLFDLKIFVRRVGMMKTSSSTDSSLVETSGSSGQYYLLSHKMAMFGQ